MTWLVDDICCLRHVTNLITGVDGCAHLPNVLLGTKLRMTFERAGSDLPFIVTCDGWHRRTYTSRLHFC